MDCSHTLPHFACDLGRKLRSSAHTLMLFALLILRAVRCCFSTLDYSLRDLFTPEALATKSDSTDKSEWSTEICLSCLIVHGPPCPSPIRAYHLPRAIQSVWKFGLHSWNPTKHCHLLIVIICLACFLTKACRRSTSHLHGNAPQYSPEPQYRDLCYH